MVAAGRRMRQPAFGPGAGTNCSARGLCVGHHGRMPPDPASADLITQAVTVAARAPSLHNSQPWRWSVTDTAGEATGPRLHLYLDRSRIVRSTDTDGREAVIACGAALDHLVTAMAAAGWSADVDRFPDPADRAHLATVSFTRRNEVTAAHRRRADAILLRRTDRLPFLAPANWPAVESVLRAVAESDSMFLDVLAAELHAELAEASALTESAQRFNSGYQAELDWWTTPFEYAEGIPRSSLMSAEEAGRVDLNRSFPAGGNRSRRAGIGTDEAVVVVLSTPADTYQDALRCGEGLSAVLLECTAAGLATCPVTHVTEIPSARAVVGAMLPRPAVPQVLIRVGRTPEIEEMPPMTPRRDVSDILR